MILRQKPCDVWIELYFEFLHPFKPEAQREALCAKPTWNETEGKVCTSFKLGLLKLVFSPPFGLSN